MYLMRDQDHGWKRVKNVLEIRGLNPRMEEHVRVIIKNRLDIGRGSVQIESRAYPVQTNDFRIVANILCFIQQLHISVNYWLGLF